LNTQNSSAPVRVTASWALANLCSCIRFKALEVYIDTSAGVLNKSSISLLVEIALRLVKDGEKVKSNAVRALGYLSRFIRFNHQADKINDPRLHNILHVPITILFAGYSNLKIFWMLVTVIQFFMEILCGLKEWYRL
jgi:hypothetical protein